MTDETKQIEELKHKAAGYQALETRYENLRIEHEKLQDRYQTLEAENRVLRGQT